MHIVFFKRSSPLSLSHFIVLLCFLFLSLYPNFSLYTHNYNSCIKRNLVIQPTFILNKTSMALLIVQANPLEQHSLHTLLSFNQKTSIAELQSCVVVPPTLRSWFSKLRCIYFRFYTLHPRTAKFFFRAMDSSLFFVCFFATGT